MRAVSQRILAVLIILTFTAPVRGDTFGSGFGVDPDGYILTNHHVIAGATKVIVSIPDIAALPATIISDDPVKDLALLKVDLTYVTTDRVKTLPLGDSSEVSELDHVITAGYPLAETIGYELSAYEGTINAIRRTQYVTLLQIDANVNPGNSGGPVLNDQGEVIGVVVAKLDALNLARMTGTIPERINFAISINDARPMIEMAVESARKAEHPSKGFIAPENQHVAIPTPTSRDALSPKEIFSAAKNAVILVLGQTADIPIPVSRLDYLAPIASEVNALINGIFQAQNAASADQVVSCFASQTEYYNLGWVHPDAIRLSLFNDWNRWPVHSDKLKHIDQMTRGNPNHNGQPTWILNFTEEIVEGTDKQILPPCEAVRRTTLVRQNGKLLFQEWQ